MGMVMTEMGTMMAMMTVMMMMVTAVMIMGSIIMVFCVGQWWFLKRRLKHQRRRWTRRPLRYLPLVKFDEKMLCTVARHCQAGLTLSINIITPCMDASLGIH